MSAPAGKQAARPERAWPTSVWFEGDKEIFFNGEAVQMLHVPNAHTDGDVMVFFRKSDVVVSGDIYRTTTFPVLDPDGGLNALIGGLNQIIDLTILLLPAVNTVDAAQQQRLASAVARAAVETEDMMAQRRFQRHGHRRGTDIDYLHSLAFRNPP